jgi:transposase
MARGDVTDAEWELIRPFVPVAAIGRLPRRLRDQFNGMIYHFRTGSQWRDLPERYGNWNTVYKRFCAWRDAQVFQTLMDALIARAAARGETDLSLVAVDSATVRAHQDASGMAASGALIDALVAAAAEEKGATVDQMANVYRRKLRAAARPRRRLRRHVVHSAASGADAGAPAPPSRSSDAPAAD